MQSHNANLTAVLNKHKDNINKPFVDMFKIAEKEGFEVSHHHSYDKDDKIIFVSKDDSFEQQNFTIAYKLSSYFLYKKIEKSTITSNYNQLPKDNEYHHYALKLLTPRPHLRQVVHDNNLNIANDKDKNILAHLFKIPSPLMLERLKDIKKEQKNKSQIIQAIILSPVILIVGIFIILIISGQNDDYYYENNQANDTVAIGNDTVSSDSLCLEETTYINNECQEQCLEGVRIDGICKKHQCPDKTWTNSAFTCKEQCPDGSWVYWLSDCVDGEKVSTSEFPTHTVIDINENILNENSTFGSANFPIQKSKHGQKIRELAETLRLTDLGWEVFTDIKTISITNDVNACGGKDSLGCLNISLNRIILKDHPEILITFSHELLHAIYIRLSSQERNNIKASLWSFYKQNKASLDREMSGYDFEYNYQMRFPTSKDVELHAWIGTEYPNIPGKLSRHYQEYLGNRMGIIQITCPDGSIITNRSATSCKIQCKDGSWEQYSWSCKNYQCADGSWVDYSFDCKKQCPDGSWETYQSDCKKQCADGSWIDYYSRCKTQCKDGSWEQYSFNCRNHQCRNGEWVKYSSDCLDYECPDGVWIARNSWNCPVKCPEGGWADYSWQCGRGYKCDDGLWQSTIYQCND